MGISQVAAIGSTTDMQAAASRNVSEVDNVSKEIENKISGIQRQMKSISSKEELSEEEKMKKRQELQKEMSRLNTQLRQRQAEAKKEQRKEAIQKETARKETSRKEAVSKEAEPKKEAVQKETSKVEAAEKGTANKEKTGKEAQRADRRNTDGNAEKDNKPGESGSVLIEEQAIYGAQSSVEQAKTQGAVIARIDRGIAVIKSEISQDENRGMNVDKKKEELAKQEKREEKAADLRKTLFQEVKEEKPDGRFFLKGTNYSRENQQEAQTMNISLT